MEKFLIEFLKEMIISQFEEYYTFYTLREGQYIRGLSDPLLTLTDIENDVTKKFTLTNVTMVDSFTLEKCKYNLMGIVSVLNGGKIRIIDYDSDSR